MSNANETIGRQIAWNRLIAVVEEQAQTLIRIAFSTTVREAGDLSAGVFDPQGRMLAQAVTGTPGHVNAMAAAVGHMLSVFPVEEMAPGDVFVTNDPWRGTGHLNDFTVVTPGSPQRPPARSCGEHQPHGRCRRLGLRHRWPGRPTKKACSFRSSASFGLVSWTGL